MVRYRDFSDRHLEVVDTDQHDAETVMLVAMTVQSRLRIAEAARTRVLPG